ncbi:MAG: hypothetical protein H7X97_00465, partial [Opitutaceae bacterium]|nr:hypothetical protein [Verrucomicrobiales bacterium]
WFAFNPSPDEFKECAIDLRYLNERIAGGHGFIKSQGDQFIRSTDGQPVRFWAVNGPPNNESGNDLKKTARLLAKRGVNLVRVHEAMFNDNGHTDSKKILRAIEIVEAMKAEGIYTHFSIYFPLWMKPKSDAEWLKGYDGTKHPFAALFFNEDFQAQYRSWWNALLTTPDPVTKKLLVDDPAVFGVELVNEDSFFFWTFRPDALPEPQLRMLEGQFGKWLKHRYGSIESAQSKWNGIKDSRDNAAEGRVGFRPLYNIFTDRTPRDQDTARFLFETQTRFYQEMTAFLRKLGFKGEITTSNWATASPQIFGPLEKLSYAGGDFIDRHGYFSTMAKGDSSAWSIRNEHTYLDRSALKFDVDAPGKPRNFVHPVMDPIYQNKPSMISETTFERPNRFRTEAPLFFAAYGALQGSDAIVHFALDGSRWSVKPGFWMQPWTLMSPVMMGQFPAAALIFRQGLIRAGETVATVTLNTNDLFALKGTPLPQDAALDELRAKDLPQGADVKPGQRLDPLLHFVGQTRVNFANATKPVVLSEAAGLIQRSRMTVTSNTKELTLDYGKGTLVLDAPQAQGIVGNVKSVGTVETRDLQITSSLNLASIVAVSLDGLPLAASKKILLQVMSEERASGFASESLPDGRRKIISIGRDPWQVRNLEGVIRFKRADAGKLSVTALDGNGYAESQTGTAR